MSVLQSQHSVGLEFCLVYSLISSSTLCILPWSLLLLSWHLYFSGLRSPPAPLSLFQSTLLHLRAVRRAYGVPDQLTDIFGKVGTLREVPTWYCSLSGPAHCQSRRGVRSGFNEVNVRIIILLSQWGNWQERDEQRQQTVKDWEESPGEGEDDGGRTTKETSNCDRLSVDRKIISKSVKYLNHIN